MPDPRIISFIASATEIVCALGFEHALVGRSHECDHPPSILSLPQCTETAFDTSGTSKDIDQRVKDMAETHTSVYRIREDLLRELKPDLIITQSQCVVCAVSESDARRALLTLSDPKPKLVTLATNGLADLWTDILQVAEALNVHDRGEALIASLKSRMDAITAAAAAIPPKPKIAYIEWIDPLMTGGNWMPELIAMAGGDNLFGKAGIHSPWLSWDDFAASDPDVILIAPCGFDLARTRAEMPALVAHPKWPTLRAVRQGRVYLADGNQYFNRPGPRLLDTLEILAEIFHPERFDFGHRPTAWTPFSS